MAIMHSITTTEDSITWRIYGFGALPEATRIFAFWIDGKKVASNIRRAPGTTDVTYTFTGLSSNTTYDLKAMFTTTATANEFEYTNTATTKKRTIYHSVSSTQNSITWRLYNFGALSTATRKFDFYIKAPSGTMQHVDTVYRSPGTTDVTYTYYGLLPGSNYELYAEMVADTGTVYDYSNSIATKEETTSMSFSASGDSGSIFMYASGINKSSFARKLQFLINGSIIHEVDIAAQETPSSYYKSYYDIDEGNTYDAEARLYKDDGQLLKTVSRSVTIPFDTSLSVRTSNVTENSVTIQAYGLGTNKKYARTLNWYRKGPDDSEFVQVSTTNIAAYTGNSSFTLPLNGLKANSSYQFKVELSGSGGYLNSVTTSANTLQASGNLAVDNIGESSVTLILSGLTNAIGRTIKWYYKKATDTEYTLAGTTSMTSSASSVSKVISGLVNETAYNFKAEIYDADDTDYVIGVKTAVATTQRQVAIMALAGATSVSLRVKLIDMETNVNYDKYIYWYIKRATDANFTEAGHDVVTADSGISTISRLFTGLVSSTLNPDGTVNEVQYDVRAVIKKNDTTTMTTLNKTFATSLRDSDIPQPTITEAIQVIGEKKAELWWEAPEHVESSEPYVKYDIMISTDGVQFDVHKTLTQPPQTYSDVTFAAFDAVYFVKIKAYPVSTSDSYKESNIIRIVPTEEFDWETVAVGNECIIKAEKWNLLIRYIRKRLADNNVTETYAMTTAKKGQEVTSSAFNQLVAACNAFYETGITEKSAGDAILASELLKLQEAVNSKEE